MCRSAISPALVRPGMPFGEFVERVSEGWALRSLKRVHVRGAKSGIPLGVACVEIDSVWLIDSVEVGGRVAN